MIAWDERYRTGDEAIDRHHKLLFEFFNDFEIEIEERRGKNYLQKSMEFVEHYINCHFGIEEFCMCKNHCPFAERNQLAHEHFKKTFAAFKKEIDMGGYSDEIAIEMHLYLEDWIKSHIIGIDTHLKDAIGK